MRTVALTLVVDSYPDTTIKICPSGGFAVACYVNAGKVADDRCEVFTPYGTFTIRGTVDEVSAALGSATAPPAQGVQDVEGAARVLLLLADAVANCDEGDAVSSLTDAIATAIGSLDKSWGGAVRGLERVAAKLRGGG